jgi:hypothetical protein
MQEHDTKIYTLEELNWKCPQCPSKKFKKITGVREPHVLGPSYETMMCENGHTFNLVAEK